MLVSVIIPSYNHQHYIVDAIQSVLNQTYQNLELIIIDDGSIDKSVELISNIKDSRIRLFTQENKGAHAAINRGLELSAGDFLTILNSDDVFELNRLEECIKRMNCKSIDFICTWINVIDSKGGFIGLKKGWKNMLPRWASNSNQKKGYWMNDDFKLNAISTNFVSTTSNMVFTREVYESIGGMRNLRFAHDWDFLLRVLADYKCDILESALLNYRVHSNNTINTNNKWMLFEVMWVLANNMSKFNDKIFKSNSADDISLKIDLAFNSINFSNNDRVFWLLQDFIKNNSEMGFSEILLNNESIRQKFINYIE